VVTRSFPEDYSADCCIPGGADSNLLCKGRQLYMKKIVHFEDTFFPTAGYQLNILSKFMAKEGYEVIIVTSEPDQKRYSKMISFFGSIDFKEEDDNFTKNYGVKIIRLPIKYVIANRVVFGNELFKTINSLEPDILYIHGNDSLTAMRFIMKMHKLPYPIVFDSHMVEMGSHNRFNKVFRKVYRKFFTPRIVRQNKIVIRTQDSDYVYKCLGIPLTQSPWISVGSDTLLFYPDEQVYTRKRKEYEISENDFLVLYTGKLDKYKGAILLAEAFKKKIKTNNGKNIVLMTVGSFIDEEGEKAKKIFSESENRILNIGTQRYLNLAQFYQMADLVVFPKQCSLSFYDAQACKIPIICEDNNISVSRLSHKNGFVYEINNKDDLIAKIKKCAEMEKEQYEELKQNAYRFVKSSYDYAYITKKYLAILQQEYDKFNKTINE
jgi:glycosyltransferase involved in cell wall biosynthesis